MDYKKSDLAINGGPKAKTTPNIPMFPGGLEIGEEEKREVMEVLDAKWLFRYYGPKEFPSKVKKLEEAYAEYLGVKHCLAVNSCTSALITGLNAVGIEPGDEVIVSSYTFFASVASVVAAKAVPVIAEVDKSLTMDIEDVEKKITSRTKVILPVHMRGMPVRMDKIMELAKNHDLKVVEDVAQSNGGSYRGKKLGSFGDVGCFSLQFHKVVTSGEGGIISTDNDLLYTRAQAYHDVAACWRKDRFAPPEFEGEIFFGVNFRMSELCGAVALAQFGKLDNIVKAMQRNKRLIKEKIKGIRGLDFREVTDEEGDVAVCLIMYLPESAIVEGFTKALNAEGVEAGGIYNKGVPDWHIYAHWKMLMEKLMPSKRGCPFNCPLSPNGSEIQYTEDMCPNTLDWLERSVHIDIPPQMTENECEQIATAIEKVSGVLL
ncbi:MAG: DegT/DnrJ/EryC1/StrS family aminotransferase [Spirochaetota bacterium]|nr:MAG: DegT/DnrJ/EryC1/StrS family aminotransferase [Spirochaetota bacterium]